MKTECSGERFGCKPLGRRDVVARFDGGDITSDGGSLLLRELEARTGIIRDFAECFIDHRDPERIEHTVEQLVAQRVYGLALGYEDLNDHDELSRDPLLATVVGKGDPTGQARRSRRDRDRPLAGKSTLNRLELTEETASADSRYKKIVLNFEAMRELPAGCCVAQFDGASDIIKAKEIIGDRICIYGDVPADLLALGSPSEVDEYCHRLIEEVWEA